MWESASMLASRDETELMRRSDDFDVTRAPRIVRELSSISTDDWSTLPIEQVSCDYTSDYLLLERGVWVSLWRAIVIVLLICIRYIAMVMSVSLVIILVTMVMY